MSGQAGNLSATFGQRVRRFATFLKFRPVVGRNAVDYNDADVESLNSHRNLVLQNVFLGLEVMNAGALYSS